MERIARRRSVITCLGALLLGVPVATAQEGERAREQQYTPTPASQVAPLSGEPLAPVPSAGAPVGPAPRAYSDDSPPAEVLNAKRPPVRISEGPYSDEAEADRARYREWRLHRFDRPVTIGLTAGYGVALDNSAKDSAGNTVTLRNPYQLGFGLQFGYTLPRYHMYFGAAATYYMGEDNPGPEAAARDIQGFSVLRTSFDMGYEFMLPWLRIRPFTSVGLSTLLIDSKTHNDQYNAAFGFGLLLMIPLGPLYIGADSRMDFVSGRSLAAANTMGIAGVLGLRL